MKKLLIGVGAVVALLIVAAIAVPFFVPVDAYKTKLIDAVRESTGRDLRIDGPMSFRLLPNIALSAENVSFSNASDGVAKNMAQLKSLEVRLRLLPLLTGTIAVDSFVLTDPVIALEIDRGGHANWDFSKPAVPGAPVSARPAAAASQGGGMAELSSFRLANLKLENGQVSYLDQRTGKRWEASAINMTFSMSGLDDPLTANGSVMWNGQKISLSYSIKRPGAFQGGAPTPVAFNVSSTPINLAFSGAGVGAPELKLSGDVNLSIPSVRNLASWAGQPISGTGKGFGPLSIKGKLDVAGATYGFGDAAIAFDDIKGKGGIVFDNSKARPYIHGSLALDQLDLNPYLGNPPTNAASPSAPAAPGPAAPGAAGAKGWSNDPIDVAPLRLADADFQLGADGIRYHNIVIGKSALELHLKDGRLVADLTGMELYKGTGQGKVTIDGSGAVPAIEQNFALKSVDMQPLLHDADNVTMLSGLGSLDVAVTGRGRSQREIVSSLNGKGSLHLDKGALKGVNAVQMVKSATSSLTGVLLGGSQTEFTSLSATYVITNGILKNSDLQMASPELPMTGAGTVDLPQRHVDYKLTPKLAGALAIPILVTGPWDNLSYRPDVGAMLKQPGKALQSVIQSSPGAVDKLKGLLGK
ncbi:MAG TPA: AsmA family protein [Stellaceae bacterium]|nr:AsmA family protein [Stellaceae bacterium]